MRLSTCLAVIIALAAGIQLLRADDSTHPLSANIGEVKFTDTPLADAMASLREKGAENLLVNWRALAEAGVDANARVSLDVANATLKQALEAIRGTLPADKRDQFSFGEHGNVVFCSTPDDATRAGKTLDALNKVMPEINFNSIPATDVFEFIRDITQQQFEVRWDVLANAKVKNNTPITLQVKNQPLGQVLRALLEQLATGSGAKLEYTVDGRTIVISTREDLTKK